MWADGELSYVLTTKDGNKVEVWKDRENNLWYQIDGDGTGYERLEDLLEECGKKDDKKT
jgi:uncharacterized protein YgiM (DUF1202 family)